MPQTSPMSWIYLVFWFSLGTNLMKSNYHMINSNMNYSVKPNKTQIFLNKTMW